MRRRLAAVGVLASAMSLAVPAIASAHTYEVSLDCDGLFVYLNNYVPGAEGATNTLRIYIDGDLEIERSFDVGLEDTFGIGSAFESHSVEVQVRAWDDDNGPVDSNNGDPSWSFDWSDSVGPCQEPEPTPKRTPRPDRTPRPTPKAFEERPPAPTIKPNLDLPPTDTAGDYGMTGGGNDQGTGQGILFLLAVMAAAGTTYGIRTVRRRAAAKR